MLDDVVGGVLDHHLFLRQGVAFLAEHLGVIVVLEGHGVVDPSLDPFDRVALAFLLELVRLAETERLDEAQVAGHVGVDGTVVHQFLQRVVHGQVRLRGEEQPLFRVPTDMLPDELGDHRGLPCPGRALEHTEVPGGDALEDGYLLTGVELQNGCPVKLLELGGLLDGHLVVTEDGFGLRRVEDEVPDLLVDRGVVGTADAGCGSELGNGVLEPVELGPVSTEVGVDGVDFAAVLLVELQELVGLLLVALKEVGEVENQALG